MAGDMIQITPEQLALAKAARAEYMRQWRARHPRAEYMRQWKARNPEKVKAYNTTYWVRRAVREAKKSGWTADTLGEVET